MVSSLPADEPSPESLRANAATWIPTSAASPGAPELQLLRNMLSQQRLYPEGFTFLPPPASPSDIIPPATVQQQMGAYYPQTAQCTVQTFEISGWAGCQLLSSFTAGSPERRRLPREQRDRGREGVQVVLAADGAEFPGAGEPRDRDVAEHPGQEPGVVIGLGKHP